MNNRKVVKRLLKIAKEIIGMVDISNGNSKINYDRKPTSLNVGETDYSLLSEDEQDEIQELLHIYGKDVESPKEFLFENFDEKMPQLFTYEIKRNVVYLIDTQGYDYARYVTELVNM